MYRLKMLNVVKETVSAEKRDFLIAQGYTLLEEPKRLANRKGKPKEENDADEEGADGTAG